MIIARQYFDPRCSTVGVLLANMWLLPADAAGAIDLGQQLTPYVGTRWRHDGGVWATVGDEPPGGWYLRSTRQYTLNRLSFSVERTDDDGIIYVHTTSWRILLRSDRVVAKTARQWTKYWNSITRPIDFPAGDPHHFELELDGEALIIRWDGKKVVHWRSPAQEWQERVNSSGRLSGDPLTYPERLDGSCLAGDNEIVVLQALGTGARFSELTLRGADRGEAQGFYKERFVALPRRPDTALERIAPIDPVRVDWSLDKRGRAKALELPAVSQWRMKPVEPQRHFGKRVGNDVQCAECFVGQERPGHFPNALHVYGRAFLFGRGEAFLPQSLSVYFNLAKAGAYTLQTSWGHWGMGWGQNVFEVHVDGRIVSRELYRSLQGNSFGCRGQDYVPLELSAGPHRIDLKLSPRHMNIPRFNCKWLRMPLYNVQLAPGIHEPIYEFKAHTQPVVQCQPAALADPGLVGEQNGKVVHYRITDLDPAKTYRVTLGFHEVDACKPGDRLMDVFVNDRQVEHNFDVLKMAGIMKYRERSYITRTRALPVDPKKVPFWHGRAPRGVTFDHELTTDSYEGLYALKVTGAKSCVVTAPVSLKQQEPQPVLVKYAAKVLTRDPKLKKQYRLGLTMRNCRYADGQVRWIAFNSELAPDPEKIGWQPLSTVFMPPKPIDTTSLDVFLPPGVTILFDDIQMFALHDRNASPAGKPNLVKNGSFEVKPQAIDVRLVGKNFKAFVNRTHVEEADGRPVFRENCGWTEILHKRFFEREYRPNTVEPIPADPKLWKDKDETFDGHNLIGNPHFSLGDDKRHKPACWWSASDLRTAKRAANLDHYDLLAGRGEYGHNPKAGHDAPGALRIGKTQARFGVMSTWPEIDYGKQWCFAVWVKADQATGSVYPEILWFAQDMSCGLRGTPPLRLLGRTKGDKAITGSTDWTKLEVTAKPPFGAAIAAPVVRVDNNSAGTVWVDDAEMNGYGTDPIWVAHSSLGYHPKGDKTLVVKTLDKAPVRWELHDATSGRAIKSGEATYHSFEWFSKRHYYQFSLGQVAPGTYRVRALQSTRQFTTAPFPVNRHIYRTLCRKVLDGLYAKRFNCDLPGFCEPGAMEDAHAHVTLWDPRFAPGEIRYEGGLRDTTGGYFDAGDEMKHIEYWPSVLVATNVLYQAMSPALRGRTPDDGLGEVLWAHRALPKMLLDDGTVYSSCKAQMRATDNIPLYRTDRHVARPLPMPQAAGALAMGACTLREVDPQLSQICVRAAIKNYECPLNQKLHTDPVQVAKALFAEMYLWKLTGEGKYRARMNEHAPMVAKALKDRAWARLSDVYGCHNPAGGLIQEFVWVPCLFVKLYPNHAAVPNMKAALRSFADGVARVSSIEPWGQAMDISTSSDSTPARYPGDQRYVNYWSALAYGLAQIGMVLEDKSIILLAERQLQWNLGKNCADLCMVHGVGNRVVAGGDMLFDQAEFFSAWLKGDRKLFCYDGCVPTLAWRHIGNGQVKMGRAGWWPPISGYPRGYYHSFLHADYPVHPAPTEYYLPQTANFLLGAVGVYEALRSLE